MRVLFLGEGVGRLRLEFLEDGRVMIREQCDPDANDGLIWHRFCLAPEVALDPAGLPLRHPDPATRLRMGREIVEHVRAWRTPAALRLRAARLARAATAETA